MPKILRNVFIVLWVFFAKSKAEWKKFEGYDYYVNNNAMNGYSQALEGCNTLGGTLATVKTAAIQNFLVGIIVEPAEFPRSFYIGLRRNNSISTNRFDRFQWDDGTLISATDSQWNTATNQPSNENVNCVVMGEQYTFNTKLLWNDIPCSSQARSVCQRVAASTSTTTKYPVYAITTTPTTMRTTTLTTDATKTQKTTTTSKTANNEPTTLSLSLDAPSIPTETTISNRFSTNSATTAQTNGTLAGSGSGTSLVGVLAGTCVGGALLLITVAVILHRIFREKNKKIENPVPEVHFQAHAAETSMNADSAQYENVKKTEQYENVVKSEQYENFSSTQHYEKIDSVTISGVTGPYEIFEAGVFSGAPTSNTPSA